jgi:hypothetical protein
VVKNCLLKTAFLLVLFCYKLPFQLQYENLFFSRKGKGKAKGKRKGNAKLETIKICIIFIRVFISASIRG